MNRRQFLAASAAVTALAAAPDEEKEIVFPVIDTHQHLWDLGKFRLPWTKDEPKLAKNHHMRDYLTATADANGHACIRYAYSKDRGATFSKPIVLSEQSEEAAKYDAFLPSIAVNKAGVILPNRFGFRVRKPGSGERCDSRKTAQGRQV
jgi:hypothetical protein